MPRYKSEEVKDLHSEDYKTLMKKPKMTETDRKIYHAQGLK